MLIENQIGFAIFSPFYIATMLPINNHHHFQRDTILNVQDGCDCDNVQWCAHIVMKMLCQLTEKEEKYRAKKKKKKTKEKKNTHTHSQWWDKMVKSEFTRVSMLIVHDFETSSMHTHTHIHPYKLTHTHEEIKRVVTLRNKCMLLPFCRWCDYNKILLHMKFLK